LTVQDFQHAIKRAIPKGQTFKGYPIQLNHVHASRVFLESMRSELCREILTARGLRPCVSSSEHGRRPGRARCACTHLSLRRATGCSVGDVCCAIPFCALICGPKTRYFSFQTRNFSLNSTGTWSPCTILKSIPVRHLMVSCCSEDEERGPAQTNTSASPPSTT
jgi:hypothetical protein